MAASLKPRPAFKDETAQGFKIYCEPTGSESKVDIIAVPGFAVEAEECFKWGPKPDKGVEDQRFNWLGSPNGLQSDFPDARIMIFRYNSQWKGDGRAEQTMDNIARSLLSALQVERQQCKERPMVFISHSMGGLVVSRALVLTSLCRKEFPQMYECFSASLFFGVPFRGTEMATIASLYTSATSMMPGWFSKGMCTSLIEYMKPDSPELSELRDQLKRLEVEMSPKIDFYYMFEMARTDFARYLPSLPLQKTVGKIIGDALPKERRMFVTKQSATFEGGRSDHLTLQHADLVRFKDTDSNEYRMTLNILTGMVKAAGSQVKARLGASKNSPVGPEAVNNILDTLSGVDMRHKRRIVSLNTPLTKWITQENAYKLWTDPTKHENPTLVIGGKEGRGKTGASLAVVEHLEARRTESLEPIRVAYFLCGVDQGYSTPEDLIKSIIYQLIYQDAMLAVHAVKFLSEDKQKAAKEESEARSEQRSWSDYRRRHVTLSLENLWLCLLDILDDSTCERTFIIINNIHHLYHSDKNDDSGEKFLNFIKSNAQKTAEEHSRHRWIFTARTDTSTLAKLESMNSRTIDMDNSDYQDQRQVVLEKYAEDRLWQLKDAKGYTPAFRYWAKNTICSKAPDAKWVEIACVQLEALDRNATGTDEERDKIEQAPVSVVDMLDALWQPILFRKDGDSASIKKVLRSLVLAFRDPTEDELMLLADIPDRNRLQYLIQQCQPLLLTQKVDGFLTIGFKHASFKHHLKEERPELLRLKDKALLREHGVLAWRCFSSIQKFLRRARAEQNAAPSAETRTESRDESPSKNGSQDGTDEKNGSQDGTDEKNGSQDGSDDDSDDDEPATDDQGIVKVNPRLVLIQAKGLAYSIQYWFKHAGLADQEFANELSRERYFCGARSPFRDGWLEDYKLLGNDFEDDELQLLGMQAMHIAAAFGFDKLVDALVKNGYNAQVNAETARGLTPLHFAAFGGHDEIIRHLLRLGAEIDAGRDTDIGTPLHMAAKRGHKTVMKTLLEEKDNPADPNAKKLSKDIGPVLNSAVLSGNVEGVQMLIDNKVTPLIFDSNERRYPLPLVLSARHSDAAAFGFILKAGKDTWQPSHYEEALLEASGSGRRKIVLAILESCKNMPRETFQKALDEAGGERNWDVAIELLNHCSGMDFDQLDCGQLFHRAAVTPREEEVRLLKAIWDYTGGLSQEAVDKALFGAVDNEKAPTVRWLLEDCNADPNAEGAEFGNALTAAANDGTLEIIQALIRHKGIKAEVDSERGFALQSAASHGHLKVVRLLVEEGGADVNRITPRIRQNTALQAACVYQHTDVVQYLLRKGANPNRGGGAYTCPIIAAARRGHQEILRLLTDPTVATYPEKIDVNVVGGRFKRTALIEATRCLPVESLKQLLDAGADVNISDQDNNTALTIAAQMGKLVSLKYLIERKSNIMHIGPNGTALKLAAERGHAACVKSLVGAVEPVLNRLERASEQGSSFAKKLISDPDNTASDIDLESENRKLKQAVEELKGESTDKGNANQKLENDVEALKGNLADKENANQKLENEVDALRGNLTDKETELKSATSRLEELQAGQQKRNAANTASVQNFMHECGRLQVELDQLKTTTANSMEQSNAYRTGLVAAGAEIEDLRDRLRRHERQQNLEPYHRSLTPTLTPETQAQRGTPIQHYQHYDASEKIALNGEATYFPNPAEDASSRGSPQDSPGIPVSPEEHSKKNSISDSWRRSSRDMLGDASRSMTNLSLSKMKFGKK